MATDAIAKAAEAAATVAVAVAGEASAGADASNDADKQKTKEEEEKLRTEQNANANARRAAQTKAADEAREAAKCNRTDCVKINNQLVHLHNEMTALKAAHLEQTENADADLELQRGLYDELQLKHIHLGQSMTRGLDASAEEKALVADAISMLKDYLTLDEEIFHMPVDRGLYDAILERIQPNRSTD